MPAEPGAAELTVLVTPLRNRQQRSAVANHKWVSQIGATRSMACSLEPAPVPDVRAGKYVATVTVAL